jgi:hypothetical protein
MGDDLRMRPPLRPRRVSPRPTPACKAWTCSPAVAMGLMLAWLGAAFAAGAALLRSRDVD